MSSHSSKLLAGGVSVAVLILLILLGPAQAFILNLDLSNAHPIKGTSTKITLSADVQNNEIINLDYFQVVINGSSPILCTFYQNGTIRSGCNGIQIVQISSAPFGYGYNYGYGYGYLAGTMKYELTLNTTGMNPGSYQVKFSVIMGENTVTIPETPLTILPQSGGDQNLVGACSIRAQDGQATVNNSTVTGRVALNLYEPLKGSSKGRGSLTIQTQKIRYSYDFVINSSQNISKDQNSFQVDGQFRSNPQNKITKKAEIILDKKGKLVSISSDTFSIDALKLTFIKGC